MSDMTRMLQFCLLKGTNCLETSGAIQVLFGRFLCNNRLLCRESSFFWYAMRSFQVEQKRHGIFALVAVVSYSGTETQ